VQNVDLNQAATPTDSKYQQNQHRTYTVSSALTRERDSKVIHRSHTHTRICRPTSETNSDQGQWYAEDGKVTAGQHTVLTVHCSVYEQHLSDVYRVISESAPVLQFLEEGPFTFQPWLQVQ